MPADTASPRNLFKVYSDPKRKVGSQSEVPGVAFSGSTISVSGYQPFKLINNKVNRRPLAHKYLAISAYLTTLRQDSEGLSSLLDIGCSAGLICFLAKESGFESVSGLDHDPEYISVLKAASERSGQDIAALVGNWREAQGEYDVVTVLALVHWIYSLTASEGSFSEIFQYLATKTRKYLLVEWIDLADPAMGSLKHVSHNPEVHKEPYTLKAFLAAAEQQVGTVDACIDTTPTRRVFVFRKERRIHGYSSIIRLTSTAAIKTFRPDILKRHPSLLEREKKALTLLSGRTGFPYLLSANDLDIYMTSVGEALSPDNIPDDAEAQSREIVATMTNLGICHNDIHPENILVQRGRLNLIDFGWASFQNEKLDFLPANILARLKSRGGQFDDQAAFDHALRRIRQQPL